MTSFWGFVRVNIVRLVFDKGDQVEFFRLVKEKSRLNRDDLGGLVGIVGRSYSDWANGKLLPEEEGVKLLSRKFDVLIPEVVEKREEWWKSASLLPHQQM